jgi:SAM-dependent methyltransferase
MDEAKKTNRIRDAAFFETYLQGKVIDIGAGKDLVCPWAERFDIEDGDANRITQYRTPASYDAVHSSHCLEHMTDPVAALNQWWTLIKPGGHLVLVVPDEDLYEQGYWPSRFNSDHKATFTTKTEKSWSPVSHNISELLATLPDAELLLVQIQDQHYDHTLKASPSTPRPKTMGLGLKLARKLVKAIPALKARYLRRIDEHLFRSHHIPIDQTAREALAQIQVVAKKRQTVS